jgi:hypothetical protein
MPTPSHFFLPILRRRLQTTVQRPLPPPRLATATGEAVAAIEEEATTVALSLVSASLSSSQHDEPPSALPCSESGPGPNGPHAAGRAAPEYRASELWPHHAAGPRVVTAPRVARRARPCAVPWAETSVGPGRARMVVGQKRPNTVPPVFSF